MAQKYKRRQYINDFPFQIQLVVRFAAIVLVAALSIGVGVFMLTKSSTTVAIEKTRVFVKPTSDFILPVLVFTVIVVSVVAATVVIFLMIIITHRIVGPIYRFKNEINAIKNGSLKRNFTTREKDKLKDLSHCLQEMSDCLHNKQVDLRGHYQALADFLKSEESSLNALSKEKLKKLLSKLEEELNYFKI